MIELRNLTKYYPVKNGRHYVLRDVSLTIPSRTNLAILGPNGAGKSTFLRIIGGSEPADSGTIITDEEISWPLGLVSGFQGILTGRQNVLFVCNINGLNADECRHVISQVLDFTELGEYFDMPVSTYSSGMNGRLKFGLSMAFDFDVYLIDELTSAGDPIFKEKAKAAFDEIRERASLIFVSQSMKTLKETCQSALFLRDGIADFYQNIDDGIEAYTEYIEKHGASHDSIGKANPALKGKLAKKTPAQSIPPEGLQAEDIVTKKVAKKAPERVAEKEVRIAARKAARKAARQAERQAARRAERLAGTSSPEVGKNSIATPQSPIKTDAGTINAGSDSDSSADHPPKM